MNWGYLCLKVKYNIKGILFILFYLSFFFKWDLECYMYIDKVSVEGIYLNF